MAFVLPSFLEKKRTGNEGRSKGGRKRRQGHGGLQAIGVLDRVALRCPGPGLVSRRCRRLDHWVSGAFPVFLIFVYYNRGFF